MGWGGVSLPPDLDRRINWHDRASGLTYAPRARGRDTIARSCNEKVSALRFAELSGVARNVEKAEPGVRRGSDFNRNQNGKVNAKEFAETLEGGTFVPPWR